MGAATKPSAGRARFLRYGIAMVPALGLLASLPLWQLAAQRDAEETEARFREAAQHDALTGLPNRLLLDQRLEEALAGAAGRPGGLALLFIDLDRSKPVNGRLGHAAGDRCCGNWRGG